MNTLLLRGIAALCVALVWCGSPFAGEPVKLLSFNVRYGNARDGENAWKFRKDFLPDVMKEGKYDFIGGQEVLIHPDAEVDQVRFLSENLPDYGMIFLCREKDPNQGEGTPVFFRKDRWEVDPEDRGTYWLSDTPDVSGSITWEGQSNCPRVVTGGLFHERDESGRRTDRAIYVYSTHFDHVGEIPRQKAAALIFAKMADRKNPNAPVVLMGDFNCGERSAAIRFLKGETVVLGGEEKVPQMKMRDTFRDVHPQEKSVATFSGFKGPKFDGNGVNIVGEKIDYIFVTPNLETTEAEILRVHRGGKYPSDHYPVRATIRFGDE